MDIAIASGVPRVQMGGFPHKKGDKQKML